MPVAHNIATNTPFACYHNTGGQSGYVLQPTERQWHSTSTTRYYAPNFEREVVGGKTTDYTYINSPYGLITAVKTSGSKHDVLLLATDHLGSIVGVWNASGTLLEEHRYSAWGLRTSSTANPRLRRGFTDHEHLQQFGLIDMQARLYDPHLGRFLAPDPYVQAPEMSMNFNRYAYCMNNPLKYVDPTGEFCFTPLIFAGAALIGAYTGGVIANDGKYDPTKWDFSSGKTWAYMGGGAVIGGVSAGFSAAVGAAGGGAWMAGAVGGALGAGGFSAMASEGDLLTTAKGAAIGAVSGFLGGAVGSAIGGGIGALAGGATANFTSQLMHNGFDASKINWAQVAISGVGAFAIYHASTYCAYRDADLQINGYKLTYKQYRTMQADYQRSRFWRKEFGGILTKNGNVIRAPRKNRHDIRVEFTPEMQRLAKEDGGNIGTYHTHWAKPGKKLFFNDLYEIVSEKNSTWNEFAANGPSSDDFKIAEYFTGNHYLIDRNNLFIYNSLAYYTTPRSYLQLYYLFSLY